MISQIKRGVSLYCFQEEMFLGQMQVEDCIAFAASIGATGHRDAARAEHAELPQRHRRRSRLVAGDCGQARLRAHLLRHVPRHQASARTALMTDEEQVASIRRDLTLCNRLGIRNMRVLVFVRPDILERCVPYAEELDVHMGVEVHAPWHLEHAWILRTIEAADRLGTKHLGILPDMGIFMKHYPPVFRARFERQGARPEVRAVHRRPARTEDHGRIHDLRGRGEDGRQQGRGRDGRDAAPRALRQPQADHANMPPTSATSRPSSTRWTPTAPIRRSPMTRSSPCSSQAGWDGYLSSEYEGNRWIQDARPVDSREQVRRQHAMFERLIAAAEQETA